MIQFKNEKFLVKMPGLEPPVLAPNWRIVYEDVLKHFSEEKVKQIEERLFHTIKPRDVFLGLGLLERFSILKQKPDMQFSPEYYENFKQRARRLMEIFGCITSSYIEDEDLCRAFLCGVVDFYGIYDSIFS